MEQVMQVFLSQKYKGYSDIKRLDSKAVTES